MQRVTCFSGQSINHLAVHGDSSTLVSNKHEFTPFYSISNNLHHHTTGNAAPIPQRELQLRKILCAQTRAVKLFYMVDTRHWGGSQSCWRGLQRVKAMSRSRMRNASYWKGDTEICSIILLLLDDVRIHRILPGCLDENNCQNNMKIIIKYKNS